MRDLGNLKKVVCAVSGGKKFVSAQSMTEKIFMPPRNHGTPRGKKIMVRPLMALIQVSV